MIQGYHILLQRELIGKKIDLLQGWGLRSHPSLCLIVFSWRLFLLHFLKAPPSLPLSISNIIMVDQIQSLPRMRSWSLVLGHNRSTLGCPHNSWIITNGKLCTQYSKSTPTQRTGGMPISIDRYNPDNEWLVAASLSSSFSGRRGTSY